MARARAGLYGLAARVFSARPTPELIEAMKGPEMIGSLAAFGIVFDEDFLAGSAEEQAEELAVEFARLFVATGRQRLAPYESVFLRAWHEDMPQLWGEATVEVAKFYGEAGLELRPGQTPDHLALELESMAVLADCESARLEAGDVTGAAETRELQDQFCREHLIRWVPEICQAVEERTGSVFYRNMAVLTASLVKLHCGETKA